MDIEVNWKKGGIRIIVAKISGIYCIENLINGKKYVGKSVDIYDRFSYHRSHLNRKDHDNSYLQNAWNKYGEENFKWYIIKEFPKNKLIEKEIFYIKKLKSKFPKGYNLTDGGDGSNNPSEETRKKMSIARLGKSLSEESKRKLSENAEINPNYGMKNKHHSEKSKRKMRKTKKGMFIGENGSLFGMKMSGSTSKYYGVHLQRGRVKGKLYEYWIASIRINKKLIQIKCSKSEIEAAQCYNDYIIKNNLPNPLNIFE